MPPKPTCKVVKREGERGARIDPKGCKVRTTKDTQGNKKKETKQGHEKIKRTTTKRDMRLAVAGSPQRHLIANWNDRPQNFRSNYKRNHNMVYDTGANIPGKCPSFVPVSPESGFLAMYSCGKRTESRVKKTSLILTSPVPSALERRSRRAKLLYL